MDKVILLYDYTNLNVLFNLQGFWDDIFFISDFNKNRDTRQILWGQKFKDHHNLQYYFTRKDIDVKREMKTVFFSKNEYFF